MVCSTCVEKWTKYYSKKGFNPKKAQKMAENLVKRLEKRLKSEGLDFIPLYLLENQKEGEDIPLFYSQKKQYSFGTKLKRWIFCTNWKATLKWHRWIGKHMGPGTNPDYTQVCTQGNCALVSGYCNPGHACAIVVDCTSVKPCKATGGCACPTPLPNSSKVSDCTITCGTSGTCTCKAATGKCTIGTCKVKNCTTGTCGYNCDQGYVWNGTACVPACVPPKILMDGLVFCKLRLLV